LRAGPAVQRPRVVHEARQEVEVEGDRLGRVAIVVEVERVGRDGELIAVGVDRRRCGDSVCTAESHRQDRIVLERNIEGV